MRTATIIVALAVVVPITASATQRARYLMGTVCEVAAESPEQIELAFAEAKRVEEMLSTWTDSSELARVNRGEKPSPELKALLDTTLEWAKKTDRAFDPRIGHLIQRVSSRAQSRDPLRLHEERSAGRGSLDFARDDTPVLFEEGAFGKGYALDRMLALLDGEALINFGGQLIVRGKHDVTIADPANRDQPVLALTIAGVSVSTSAGAHILDPRTGKSVGDRGSVSVIATDALTADILSTALYVMGEDDGLRWAAANDVAAIFINPNRTVRLSPAARERARGLAVIDRNFSLKD
jgi:FAD:protein FMN transferase